MSSTSALSVGANAPTTYHNEFYVTLPSNSSMQYFPLNTAAAFRTKLAQPIQLKGKWEMALAEIQYPRSWANVRHDMKFMYDEGDGLIRETVLPRGYYGSAEEVFDTINDGITEAGRKQFSFKRRESDNKIEVVVGSEAKIYWKDSELRRLLGIDQRHNIFRGPSIFKGDYPCDVKHGVYALYVYTDIASPVLVGDAHVPLLRTVPVQGKFGDVITVSLDKLHYVPLSTSHFDELEIHIATDHGSLISFEFGKVIVKLHFRPRRLFYL